MLGWPSGTAPGNADLQIGRSCRVNGNVLQDCLHAVVTWTHNLYPPLPHGRGSVSGRSRDRKGAVDMGLVYLLAKIAFSTRKA